MCVEFIRHSLRFIVLVCVMVHDILRLANYIQKGV